MTTTDPTRTSESATSGGAARRAGTGTTGTRILGIATIISMGWLIAFGLGILTRGSRPG